LGPVNKGRQVGLPERDNAFCQAATEAQLQGLPAYLIGSHLGRTSELCTSKH